MCDACGHKFKNPQALNAHMIIHIDDPEEKDKLKNYPCKLCSKKFSSSSRLSKVEKYLLTVAFSITLLSPDL